MEIPKTYSPQAVEAAWYQAWLERGFFKSSPNPEKEPYTIVMPPPNVTGVLHMGHMLNNTIQDVLVRRARMQGKEALWVPGTDHASIATEAKVVAMLKEQGIDKRRIGREAFLEHAFAWKDKYGGIILEQLKKLGASCDWDRTRFTMEPKLTAAVLRVFVDLYRKGHIYRGVRMVNWDPEGRTAIADDEVIAREIPMKMYYLRYEVVEASSPELQAASSELEAESLQLVANSKYVIVATSRPETIMADVAVCFHPDDERYQHLRGRKLRIPLFNKEIPVIFDDYIAMEFGTGALKVTPAHDINDYEIGLRHNLPVVDALREDGTLSELGGPYAGMDRFVVRKQIAKDLKEAGLLEKVEDYTTSVSTSERTGAVIEPKLSLQWFLKMEPFKARALEAVMSDRVRLLPPKFKNMYRTWMENVRDWCISRQLWWGQRIPAYYLEDGRFVVAETDSEALVEARKLTGNPALQLDQLRQDDDVLDTWFSSWLWPISVFDGFEDPHNADVSYYYPTNDLVTAPEILFFWVARMIIAGQEWRGKVPFKNVYLTGIVRDAQGRKMSKSLGNSPDPLDLIAEFGADAVRTGMLFSSPAGNDLLYDQKLVEQGRNFNNKLWNAFRLLKGWEVSEGAPQPEAARLAGEWFGAKLSHSIGQLDAAFADYRLSDALLAVYKLTWDDFCSTYLELIKPPFGEPIDARTLAQATDFLETLLRALHPFVPFLTEEIWHRLRERGDRDYCCVAPWPTPGPFDAAFLSRFERALDVVQAVRNQRAAKGLSPNLALPLVARDGAALAGVEPVVQKLANLSALTVGEAPAGAVPVVAGGTELALVLPEGSFDVEAERARLTKDLDYTRGFLASVEKKLSNQKFVANAKPEILEAERKKQADALAKIAALEAQLGAL